MNKQIKYLFQLPLFLLIQIYILNEILFASYINPHLYLIVLIIMPFKTPKWYLLIYSFAFGFFIDIFSGNLGMHSTACLILAILKNTISKITVPHNIIEENDEFTIQKIGGKSFILFSTILVFIHHLTLFVLEHANLNFQIIIKIILSTIFTSLIISVIQLFLYKT